jgi:hypothetical protein
MTRIAPRRFLLLSLAAGVTGIMLSGPASACCFIPAPQAAVDVVEYYNVHLRHYFLTAHPSEMEDIEAGSAGDGWIRTGLSFTAYPADSPQPGYYCADGCGVPVSRFYTHIGNTHFYTADPAEAAGLEQPQSGWILEQREFRIPVPDATGQCAAGLVPVFRLYNHRAVYHDANHRYVTDAGERERMIALGWIDEGVRFCALGAKAVPIKSYAITARAPTRVMPSAQCEDEAVNRGSCIAVNNLPVPSLLFPKSGGTTPRDFVDLTGQAMSTRLFVVPGASAPDLPEYAFVEDAGSTIGIHVDTRGRGPASLSSVNPLYQFHTGVDAGRFDDRFFPFGPSESAVQLAVHFTLNVKSIGTRGAGSAAYGHPTLELIDQRSAHHLYFTVLTYGTVAPADFLGVDSSTGKAIVGTTFRAQTPYGRSMALPTLFTPSGFVPDNPWGWGGYFEFRVDRTEFQRILDAARTLDPALSASPADYLLDNFHFNDEVAGDGAIGINLADYTLELLRR